MPCALFDATNGTNHGALVSVLLARSCMAACPSCARVMCMVNSTCDDNNLDPDLSKTEPVEVWNQWLTSFYWALTMLMKMPNVGPDTVLEKAFSCFTVIVGAIFFALLLGQVTTLIMVTAKAGSQLREQLVVISTFTASRRVPARMSREMRKHMSAEWSMTRGMDLQGLLNDFPTQLKGDVLEAVFASLIECNPSYLQCSDQLRKEILALLKPSVALKKQTIIAGRQFGATIYILMKGSLQVSQAPAADVERSTDGNGSPEGPNMARRGMSMGAKDLKKQLTRSNTKGFKDKLKVRMLEREGSIIPLDTIFEGARTSPFSVFAVSQCNLLTMEANDLSRLLELYPAEDADKVTLALDTEFKGLMESLKMNRGQGAGDSSRESKLGEGVSGGAEAAAPQAVRKVSKAEVPLPDKVTLMENQARALIEQLDFLQQESVKVPVVLRALAQRLGMDPDDPVPPSMPPSPGELDSPSAKPGGFFGFCSSRTDSSEGVAAASSP